MISLSCIKEEVLFPHYACAHVTKLQIVDMCERISHS